MAHLWTIDDVGAWAAMSLDADVLLLADSGLTRVAGAAEALRAASSAMLHRDGRGAHARWTLLVPPHAPILVNGAPVPLGIVALADRDEIRLAPGSRMFFSTETLATVEPYPADSPRGFCPRCKQRIEPGSAAVKCPACGLWHHASGALPCWTYGENCAACPQATSLEAGFGWTPEEI